MVKQHFCCPIIKEVNNIAKVKVSQNLNNKPPPRKNYVSVIYKLSSPVKFTIRYKQYL